MALLRYTWVVLLLAGVTSALTGIRLRGGKHQHEGRVEIEHDGQWKAVCDHGWNKYAARVVCRMLGFPDMLRYTKGQDRFGQITYNYWLDDVRCRGDEESIEQCGHREWGKHNCRRYNQAGVVCKLDLTDSVTFAEPPKSINKVLSLKVRLQGPVVDDYISEGVVQVEHEGKWGYICPSQWTQFNSYVLCGQLGFPDAEELESHTKTIQDLEPVYWLDQVTCRGWESSIVSCDHSGWRPKQCEEGGAVRIECTRRREDKPHSIRLRSGAQMSEGRVEIKYKGSWGTVCDDHWTLKEANIVCRSLGFGSAAAATKAAHYGKGVGKIMLDNVRCEGSERTITQCRHHDWYKTNCDHYEDAGVKCHAPELQGHQIRLSGGGSISEGRVEVFHDGKWGTVCADGWGIEEAMTVCRQLNLGFASQAVIEGNFGGEVLPAILSGVQCRVDAISIYNCEHDEFANTKCSSKGKVAGVVCVDALPDIVPDVELLRKDMKMQSIPMEYLRCSLEENCLSDSANYIRNPGYHSRRLLRFSVKIENQGLADFRPNFPKSEWQWHKCHKHYHSMETFTTYDLIDKDSGEKVAQGHKASFCLEDTMCDPGYDKKFNCSEEGGQGISPGCYDIYNWKIDCQWVDCSDFQHGSFYLRVHLNPGNQVAESDFRNNVAKCSVYDYGNYIVTSKCKIEDCDSGVDTHGGNSAGNCCVFPFRYNRKLYHDCTMDGYTLKWCSTTFDFKQDGKWGLCYN